MKLTTLRPRWVAVVVAATAGTAFAVIPSAAQAATPTFGYASYAAGTRVQALGTVISSDLTALSQASGITAKANGNKTAAVEIPGLLKVGAVTSDVTGSLYGDGTKVVAHSRTAGISILNGLIQADAIDTTVTSTASSTTTPSTSGGTTLLGLTIAGKKLPVNLPANTTIGIPGIATVTINAIASSTNADGTLVIGDGILVTLLQPRGNAAAGATIAINPVFAMQQKVADAVDGRPIASRGYGTAVSAHLASAVKAESGPTALLGVPSIGTKGKTLTNSTARVRVPWLLDLGAVQTTAEGTQSPTASDVTQTAGVANLNLFNGLITAKAIETRASTKVTDQNTISNVGSMDFVNLTIGGKAIPLNVPPNTSINIVGLGRITINEQTPTVNGQQVGMKVIGLHIVLDTARAGLPVGADITVAYSQTLIY